MTTRSAATLGKEIEKEVFQAIKIYCPELRVFCNQMKNGIRVGIHQFERKELSAWIDVSDQITLSIRESHKAHLPSFFLQFLKEIVEKRNNLRILPSQEPKKVKSDDNYEFEQRSFDRVVAKLNRRYGEGNWSQSDLDDELG